MELLQLEYFRQIARSEHVTKTANRMHVTQSSLSRTLQRLEEDLGTPLFDRIGRTMRLNEPGRRFLVRVERVFRELEEGRNELADGGEDTVGEVSLVVTTASSLPGILTLFKSRYPQIRFHVRMGTDDELIETLRRGEADLGICSARPKVNEFEYKVVFVDELVLAAPETRTDLGESIQAEGSGGNNLRTTSGYTSTSRKKARTSLISLRDEDFVGMRKGYHTRDLTDRLCESAGFTPRYVYEGNEPARIPSLVEAAIGVAFVPAAAISMGKRLRFCRLAAEGFERNIGLTWNRNHYLSKAAQCVRDIVIEYFQSADRSYAPA